MESYFWHSSPYSTTRQFAHISTHKVNTEVSNRSTNTASNRTESMGSLDDVHASLVRKEMIFAKETVVALIARERSLVIVIAVDVDGEFAFLLESFLADLTRVERRRLVLAALVSGQRTCRRKSPHAFRTLERFLARMFESQTKCQENQAVCFTIRNCVSNSEY
jgi:hypothetical protein